MDAWGSQKNRYLVLEVLQKQLLAEVRIILISGTISMFRAARPYHVPGLSKGKTRQKQGKGTPKAKQDEGKAKAKQM